jgi:hypothetical protein
MRNRTLASVCSAAVFVALASWAEAPAAAQSGRVPRTAWGKPDLSGIWDFRTITPLERPASQANREFLTEEEALKLERDVVERNRASMTSAERTTAVATSTGAPMDHRASITTSGWTAEQAGRPARR